MASSLSNSIAITGIGESRLEAGGGHRTEPLIVEACDNAIADAGLERSDVDGIVTDSKIMPEVMYAGELNEQMGLECEFSATSLTAGAGNVASPLLAAQAIKHGLADHVLTYFGTNWASQLEVSSGLDAGPYSYHLQDPNKTDFELPFGWFTQPVYFAGIARRHMHEYGTTSEQLGQIAVQTRANAAGNQRAQKSERIDLEDYRANPTIADPLKFLDCCLISDGAGAFVMSSADATADSTDPVYVKGVGQACSAKSGSSYFTQVPDFTSFPSRESGEKAYSMAGLTPADIDFAELYDCFTISTLIQLEDLGFCEKGKGGEFVEAEGLSVENGTLPVNTHGGLLSHSYLVGIEHVLEAVRQLRQTAHNQVDDPDYGLVSGLGAPEHATLILGRDR